MKIKPAFALFAFSAFVAAAASPSALNDFAWRAPLQLPPNTGLARVELPAAALARMQSADARDVRVFNAAGDAVPFAWITPPASSTNAPEERTRSFAALPLYASAPSKARPKDSMQVRIDGRTGSVWVHTDGGDTTGAQRLDSALFATRDETHRIAAIEMQGTLPANVPVRVAAWTSPDLATWTPVPLRGRIYRFDGAGAPTNMRLAFDAPIEWKDRYLRLDWSGQDGVSISSVTGIVASAVPAPRRVRTELAAAKSSNADAMDIDTGFATPMAALAIEAQQDNTLVPVRVLARSDASQPWRLLGQTVIYRIGSNGDRMTNPPLELHGASARTLRIQSTNGAALASARLRVSAEFQPPQLVFVASGAGPFVLAAGHRDANAAALPASTITGMLGAKKIDDVPLVQPGTATETALARGPFDWIPGAPGKPAVLWAVLIAGVLLLGGVAWSLLRQMRRGGGSQA
jgi:hypothetical protein